MLNRVYVCPVVYRGLHENPAVLLRHAKRKQPFVMQFLQHLLAPTVGSRISAAHLPHGRCLTPLYVLFLPFDTTTSGGTPSGTMGGGGSSVVETCAM